jgi:hypothetical protein
MNTLNLTDTDITEIPDGLYVERFIILNGTKITSIPKSINDVCQVLSDYQRSFEDVAEFNKRSRYSMDEKPLEIAKLSG